MILIDIHQTVYDIVKANPEFKAVLIEAGFTKLSDSSILNTMGKIVTLQKGMMFLGVSITNLEIISNRYNFTIQG